MNKDKKIAIVIVNWNQYELTKQCLLSLRKCTYNNYKVILIDNNSSDNSGKKLKSFFKEIKFFQNNQNEGFTGANNRGIKYALSKKFDYVMLLNNDTEVSPDFLDPLLKTFNEDKQIGAVQPLILYWKKELVWNYGGEFQKITGRVITLNRGKSKFNIKKSKYTDWISGCCFMLKTEVIKKIGLLDDFYFVYYEDADWSIRINNAGFKLALNFESVVFHHEGSSWKSKKRKWEGSISPMTHYLNIRNHIYFVKKHNNKFSSLGKWVYQFCKIFGYTIYFLFRLRFGKLKIASQGFIDGIFNKELEK
tara:strand:- start:10455 stop:11372 length:918 start_codon:yes stop_codon:yes gene_type:complete